MRAEDELTPDRQVVWRPGRRLQLDVNVAGVPDCRRLKQEQALPVREVALAAFRPWAAGYNRRQNRLRDQLPDEVRAGNPVDAQLDHFRPGLGRQRDVPPR